MILGHLFQRRRLAQQRCRGICSILALLVAILSGYWELPGRSALCSC
jgi:hypothetical protein